MLKLSDVAEATNAQFYYLFLVSDDEHILGSNLFSQVRDNVSVNLVRRAVSLCAEQGDIEKVRSQNFTLSSRRANQSNEEPSINNTNWKISDHLLKYAEKNPKFLLEKRKLVFFDFEGRTNPLNFLFQLDAWKEPDEYGTLSATDLEELKSLLQELLDKINESSLDQSDKADASQRVKACQDIAEAPHPRLGVIKIIIDTFRIFSTAAINTTATTLVEKILAKIFGN